MSDVIRCRHCGDVVECVEGVLWIHEWTKEFPQIRFPQQWCLLDSWERHQGRRATLEDILTTYSAAPDRGALSTL